jgi:hypothetical protein
MTTQIERTTKEIVTPGGYKVVLNSYLTGGEMRKVQAVMAEGMTSNDFMASGGPNMQAVSVFKAQELALEFLLVSINDGTKEESYKLAMDLPASELGFIMKEVDEKIGGEEDKKKQ